MKKYLVAHNIESHDERVAVWSLPSLINTPRDIGMLVDNCTKGTGSICILMNRTDVDIYMSASIDFTDIAEVDKHFKKSNLNYNLDFSKEEINAVLEQQPHLFI